MNSSHIINLEGRQFGRLKVLEFAGTVGGMALWRCRCRCGNTHITRSASLRNGQTRSCGCYRSEIARKVMKEVNE